jgi:drug/metabolite transporter, DME family
VRALIGAVFYALALRPDLRKASWATACAYAATVVSFVISNKLTTAANAIFLQYMAPAWVLLLSPWLLGERLRRADVVSVVLSMAGLSLFFVGKVDPGAAAGNLVGVFSGVAFGLTMLFMRRDARHGAQHDAVASTLLGNLIAAGVSLPFALGAFGPLLAGPGAQLGKAVFGLLWLGIVQIGVAYLCFARGLRSVRAAEASVLLMMEPLFNPVWVLLGTGERPSGWAIAGGAIVLAAVLVRTAASRE